MCVNGMRSAQECALPQATPGHCIKICIRMMEIRSNIGKNTISRVT